jgi:hypothetical protein
MLEKKLRKYVGGRKNFMKKKNWKNCKGNMKETTLKNSMRVYERSGKASNQELLCVEINKGLW